MTIGTTCTKILSVVLLRCLLVVNILNILAGLHPQDDGAYMFPALISEQVLSQLGSMTGLSQHIYIYIYICGSGCVVGVEYQDDML